MIDYKLAKELKDAGFLFKRDAIWCESLYNTKPTEMDFETVWNKGKGFYDPTLSELIEACESGTNPFVLESSLHPVKKWHAVLVAQVDAYGETPEEAVVKLYIALNKK